MAKISNPIRFSEHFEIDEKVLASEGVLNPSLAVDTGLFIDPFLLGHSAHPEISDNALSTYEAYFEQVARLLRASKTVDDVAWRSARRLMTFPEVKWTCLGYGARSISGAGSGGATTQVVMQTAKDIVDLGVEDPDLFVALGVFENGIGPDRISDMTSNVILGDLLALNVRVLEKIGVPTTPVTLELKNGNTFKVSLPLNPFQRKGTPIILVPTDILRDLPIAQDWSEVAAAASKNAALRTKVNKQIAEIWKRKTLKEKGELRRWAMSSRSAFETFLELLKGAHPKPYDMVGDPIGELVWKRVAEIIGAQEPFRLSAPKSSSAADVASVVEKIVGQFQFLIEQRRLSEELYHQGKQRPEKAAQRLFFAVAYAYCKANNLDLTPEADTGNGPVDFKLSAGFDGRVLVEIKLSTNPKLLAGYSRQLETYKDAEQTTHGFYIVIDVGGNMGSKADKLMVLKNSEAKAGRPTSSITFIDGKRRKSASKL